MKAQYTRWSPDTCGCEIIYTWDSDMPAEERIHTVHEIEKKCEAHNDISHGKTHYDTVLEENQRKNRAHTHINNGESPIEWEWDADRILHITTYEGKKDKSELQLIIDKELEKHGHGKVVLH